MIFRGRPTDDQKLNWHHVFAWWPVPLGNGIYCWLETVERRYKWKGRMTDRFYDPMYRRIEFAATSHEKEDGSHPGVSK